MLTVTLSDLDSDIAAMMKGTSTRQIDIYGIAAKAASRMLTRIDSDETRRTATLSTPFYDNLNDYTIATDYKRMIDIRPQANRVDMPGNSDFSQTSPRQFNERLDANSFSIRWNNMVRTLRAQRLPGGNVVVLDPFDTPTANGAWTVGGDASNIGTEILDYVQGNGATSFDLSGSTGAANIVNTTAAVADLSAYNNKDASMMWIKIPAGKSALFTSFELRRGTNATNYIKKSVTTKADGTAFTDGWNFLLFDWSTGTTVGTPTNLVNTYRNFAITYTSGTAMTGFLIDSWVNAFGQLYEMEYYSEYLFRTSAGVWIQKPTVLTDLINVGIATYEILKTEMMVDISQIIRSGSTKQSELQDWRLMLNGQSASRWVKDPPYHGLYADYTSKYQSSAIPEVVRYYDFDI